jgi:hypothetical protein
MKELLSAEIDTTQPILNLLIPKMENGTLFKQIMMSGKMEDALTDVQQLRKILIESGKQTWTSMF